MYLRCRCRTDNGIFLGKCLSSGYYTANYQHDNTLIDRLNDYYNKHIGCFWGSDENNKNNWNKENQFYIEYEFN